MGALIDTSVLIAAERGLLDLGAVQSQDEEIAIASITASELLHGVHRARTAAQRARREALVEGLLTRLPVLDFDLVAARTHARIWADLQKRGMMIGAHDLLIGATALARGFGVATRDERSFPNIAGLRVLRW